MKKRITIICITILIMLTGCGTDKYEKIPLSLLMGDFDNNIIDCKNKYDGKNIETGGTIDEIGIDENGKAYIIMWKSKYFSDSPYVKCIITNKKQIKKMSDYKVGDIITIKGKCNIKSNYILFKKCKIVSN